MGRTTGVRLPTEVGIFFLFPTASGPALGPTQPPNQCVPKALFPTVKRTWYQADHLNLVPKLRMRGAIHRLPQYVFMSWYRDNFAFTMNRFKQ